MKDNPGKTRRIIFMLSGATDALIGAVLLLIGFQWFPIDIVQYGFQNWHAILVGAVFFITGAGFVAYNLSRFEE
jgi:hypothetical protein